MKGNLPLYLAMLGIEQAADYLHQKSPTLFPVDVYALPEYPLSVPFQMHAYNRQAEMARACYTGKAIWCNVTPFRP